MRVLLVGGAGLVGSLITPYLVQKHSIRVFDVRPPNELHSAEFVQGSMTDADALADALEGCDAFINLAMRNGTNDKPFDQTPETIAANYDVNVLGLHTLLFACWRSGVTSGVHTSTMAVTDRSRPWYPQEQSTPLDAGSVYGFTKGLGEIICQYFARWFDMNIIALRITAPRSRADFFADRATRGADFRGPLFTTDEEDLARAYLAALDAAAVGHGQFEACTVVGDELEVTHNLSKAKRLLGWEPLSHLAGGEKE